MYGGTCINIGCLPSKNLVKSADKISEMDVDFKRKSELFHDAITEKMEMVKMLNGKNFKKLDSMENVDVIDGFGSFIDAHTVKVETEDGDIILEADKIYINTGAYTSIPDMEGIKDNPHIHDSETIMELAELPKKLTIVGGSYIALEFASMYSDFGSDVTVLDRGDRFLKREDEDLAEEIKSILMGKGIHIIQGASTKRFAEDIVYYEVDGEELSIEGTEILLATGRNPNVEKLNLEAAGVELTDRGLIKVDEHLKTTADNIYAMGDVAQNLQFTYISLDDYRIVNSVVSGDGSYTMEDRKNVPYSMFITPPFVRVGINEDEAKKRGIKYEVKTMKTAEIPKAQVLGKTAGMLKVLIGEDKKILGAMLLCEEAHEIINIIKLAMDLDQDYTVLRDMIYTHPTMAEAFNDLFNL